MKKIKNKSIAILTQSCKYFAAPFLAASLDADLYSIDHSQDNFFDIKHEAKRFNKDIGIDKEHLILIGARAVLFADAKLKLNKFKSVAIIFSDTNCARLESKWKKTINKWIKKPVIYAMPDLLQYCFEDTIPCFQTITLPKTNVSKPDDKIVISHSPGIKEKYKGTKYIKSVVDLLKKKHNIEFNLITNDTWNECIKIKALSHIFIDQIVEGNNDIDQKRYRNEKLYRGALAKSGLEGMLLECCTITGCPQLVTEPYFPYPPVAYTDHKDFPDTLENLIEYKSQIETISKTQKKWADKYLSPQFVSKHLTRHIS